jgi:hypothetical protein
MACAGCERRKAILKGWIMKFDGLHIVSFLVGAALVFAYFKFVQGA